MPSWWCFQRPAAVIEEGHATVGKMHSSVAESRLLCADAAADAAGSVIAVRSEPAVIATAAVLQPIGGQQTCLRQSGLPRQEPQQRQQQQGPQHPRQQQLHQDQGLQAVQPDNSSCIDIQFHVPFGELVFHQVIGQGSSKTVYRGRWRNTNVAIMRMRKGGLVTEARLMQKLSTHPNLVQFYRWSQDTQGNEYIIVELISLGSLDKILLRLGVVLRTSMKMSVAEQIAAAMAELTSEGVLHRDLAVRNVLVQSLQPVHVKVADFGLAQQVANSATNNNTSGRRGASLLNSIPVRWCSPEVLTHQAWGVASDVWAFGVTLWEIFADGAEPYAALTDLEVAQTILAGGRLPRPPRCPREMYSLMKQCWAADPADRPLFDDILSTFSAWRQKHAKQAQLAQQCGNSTNSAPIDLSHVLRARSSEPHHTWFATAATPAALPSPFCTASSVCSSKALDGQLLSLRCLTGSYGRSSMQEGIPLGPVPSVYRCLSEPLPGWNLNQHVKAVLQPPAAASSLHSSTVLGRSWALGGQVASPVGTLDSHSSISSATARGAAARLDADCWCGRGNAADSGWPAGHEKALQSQHKQQVAQLVCCASLSRQSSGDSYLSQVSASHSSSFVGGSEYTGYLDSISEDGQSVDLSFELEKTIDPNGQQEQEVLVDIIGSWETVLLPTHTTTTCASGSVPPVAVRNSRDSAVPTAALAVNNCHTVSRQVTRAGVACVPRCSAYVDVTSLVYGSVQADVAWSTAKSGKV